MFIRIKFHWVSYISSGNSSQIGVQDRKVHSNREKQKKKTSNRRKDGNKKMDGIHK